MAAKLLIGAATCMVWAESVADRVCVTNDFMSWPAVIPEADLMDVEGS